MKIPKEARRFARELFTACLDSGRLNPDRVRSLSGRLVESKPRFYVPTLKEFARLVRLELQKRHAIVQSATALDPAESKSIETEIRTKFGSDVTLEFAVVPALLGGLRVQVGSDVWDGTVRTRLDLLKQKL